MRIEDQAQKLRRLMREARRTQTIAVTSGKGGVGKSNIALNLSILMSAAGRRVALIDADLGLANLDVLMDITVRRNISHVIAGTCGLADVIVDLPGGVQLLPGASGLSSVTRLSEFQRRRLLDDLSALEDDNEVIVIDTAAGIGPDVLQFAAGADHVLVVTTPEPTAITDGYAVIKVLRQGGRAAGVGLVVNLAPDRGKARQTYQRVAGVARRFLGIDLADGGYVLDDPRVRQAVLSREPFVLAYPRCPASKCLAGVADRLAAGNAAARGEGFFKRVVNWLS